MFEFLKMASTTIGFVVDRSGSMQSVRDDTIEGLNGYIEEQKDGNVSFFPVLFDDCFFFPHTGQQFSRINCETLAKIPLVKGRDMKPFSKDGTSGTWIYKPRGSTALVDAIGHTISRLDEFSGHKVLVVQTDGKENASMEFTKEDILKMIKDRRERDDWDFYFLGAESDAIKVASSSYGFTRDKCLKYGKKNHSRRVWKACSAAITRARRGCYSGFTKVEAEEVDSD